jgi:hypothetical protein
MGGHGGQEALCQSLRNVDSSRRRVTKRALFLESIYNYGYSAPGMTFFLLDLTSLKVSTIHERKCATSLKNIPAHNLG